MLTIGIIAYPTGAAGIQAAPPGVSAQAYAVYDTRSGRFLTGVNGDAVLPMASTTKIVTAITAIENMNLDQEITVKKEHLSEGSSMYLKVGEKLRIRELLYGLMLMSGNDAALAIADSYGADGEFVGLMNGLAKKLGLEHTAFANPNGLDDENHYTTAKELALISAYAMQNDTFREIVGTRKINIAGRYMSNHNRILNRVEGATGIKTGYTKRSGRCLVSSVLRDGREIIVVTLNAPSDWSDHAALHECAFREYEVKQVVAEGYAVENVQVISGDLPRVAVYAANSIEIALTGSEAERLETRLYLRPFYYAPLKAGDRAGELAVLLDGEEIGRTDLLFDSEAVRNSEKRGGIFHNFIENIVLKWFI